MVRARQWGLGTPNPGGMGFGGPSAAMPFVAGVAALLRSIPITPGALLLGEDLEQIMKHTASGEGTWNEQTGYGVVKAKRALDFIDPASKHVLQGALGWGGTHGSLSVVAESDEVRTFFGVPGIPENVPTACRKYTLQGTVLYGSIFSQPPAVWTRPSGTSGSRGSRVIDARGEVPGGRNVGVPAAAAGSLGTFVF